MNEADTRAELIDPQLVKAGWVTGGDVRVLRAHTIYPGEIRVGGNRAAKLEADYVLSYRNRKLAVVEAKRDEKDVSEGVAQAKLYAQKLNLETTYAANGKEIYQICLKTGTEGLVERFLTPEQLWEKTFPEKNDWLDRFNAIPFEDIQGKHGERYYQEIAVNKAMAAIANNKQRILLTLATGTGKTFIAFQIAWKLFQSRWTQQKDGKRAPRILFLADRNILANQAHASFAGFHDDARVRIDPDEISKRGEVPKNGNVFFTIYQTFMSGGAGEPYFGEYESDFFDLVIIDECHRGGANDESSWRAILDHFDSAVHVGLTATPKRQENGDTYEYFGEPVFTYSLREGIQDGFLTPFKVIRIQTTIDEYVYTADDEILEGEVDEGHVYTEKEFNRKIVIPERERKRVQEMLESINQNEKTLVFCGNQAHAALVRDLINQESASTSVDYCARVTANDGKIGDAFLWRFRDNETILPTILTTSHKLTTGVDACNVRNIVLLRPVNSMIEFKQIIGRGTRVFEGKYYFTIVDFVNAFHLFSDPEWDGDPIDPLPPRSPSPPRPPGGGEDEPTPTPKKIQIKLAEGKVRALESMSSTYFFVEGNPISAEEFIKHLFGTVDLPKLLTSEETLRETWASPITRRELLSRLETEGCPKDDLVKLQEVINAENSDLFDVLQYIAYARAPMSRSDRVAVAEENIYTFLNTSQREFIKFVLGNYMQQGVDELDDAKLSTVLTAKYGSVHAAAQQLGKPEEIRKLFIDFQRHLYQETAA